MSIVSLITFILVTFKCLGVLKSDSPKVSLAIPGIKESFDVIAYFLTDPNLFFLKLLLK